uniref:B30.2/SPRY domain-containing protein n=1 Tax=Periophthalmus magnuspinnatus TaxID=409849 RepID=A0A3B3ZBB8_9GOBI
NQNKMDLSTSHRLITLCLRRGNNILAQIRKKQHFFNRNCWTFFVSAVDVKLDPGTAHLWLILSEDGKAVRDGGQCQQQLPARTGRFDSFGSVVGAGSFSSGRAYWEVQVGDKSGWDLGVTSAKANRQGKLKLSPNGGYWAIVHYEGDKYAALTAPPVCVRLKHKPQKVGVFLDYDEGLVSFYNVTDSTHIYSFTKCSFDDGVLPYFSPHPEKNGKNAAPLVITQVNV